MPHDAGDEAPYVFHGPGHLQLPLMSRRSTLQLLAATALALLFPRAAVALRSTSDRSSNDHPDPRPGIDGSRVLTADQLPDAQDMIDVFDGIRRIPHIADGIRCYCGCAQRADYRSLLSCYEGDGMARYCDICEGEGRLAVRRAAEGQNLDQIRRAIDARYRQGAGQASAGRTAPGVGDIAAAAAGAHCRR